jgi:rare lipoprotein A
MMPCLKQAASVALLALLAACAGDNRPWNHVPNSSEIIDYSAKQRAAGKIPAAVKIGKSYTVNGRTYTPRYDPSYTEEGIASWYGPGFHGGSTANGEEYNKHDYTAAHTTLPLPSLVRVTNLDNGRKIVARINDRGPFARGRIIDISHEGAQALDMVRTGTANVRVEYLENETRQMWSRLAMKEPPEVMVAEGRDQPTVSSAPAGSIAVRDSMPDALPENVTSSTNVTTTTTMVTPPAEGLVAPVEDWQAPLSNTSEMQQQAMNDTGEAAIAPHAGQPAALGSLPEQPFTPPAVRGTAAPEYYAPSVSPVHGESVVQAGSFSNQQNAEKAAYKLAELGDVEVKQVNVNGRPFWRIRVTSTQMQPEDLKSYMLRSGYGDAKIIR